MQLMSSQIRKRTFRGAQNWTGFFRLAQARIWFSNQLPLKIISVNDNLNTIYRKPDDCCMDC